MHLTMDAHSKIDHFNVAIHLDKIVLEKGSKIGRNNWITGFPLNTSSSHFKHQAKRCPELHLGEESAITKRHHIDCTNMIIIGKFTIIGGYQSQLLTHSINVYESRQDSAPISIGDYSFIGTNVVILGGSSLPSYSVLGAKSLLNKNLTETHYLYAGVPAAAVQKIQAQAKYFHRENGYVD